MPIYEYRCQNCDHPFEKLVRMSQADEAQVCPACGEANTKRQLSTFAVGRGGSSRTASVPTTPRPRFT